MRASYGGYGGMWGAMWGAARDPDLWRCAISIAGVSSLRREVNDMGFESLNGNSNHDFTRQAGRLILLNAMGAFLDRHKPAH